MSFCIVTMKLTKLLLSKLHVLYLHNDIIGEKFDVTLNDIKNVIDIPSGFEFI